MKKSLMALASVLALSIAASPALADGNKKRGQHFKPQKRCFCGFCWTSKPKRHHGHYAVPEIDAASSAIALALAAGVLSMARERKRSS